MLRKSFKAELLTRRKQLVSRVVLATALATVALGNAGIVFAAQNSTIFVSNVEQLYEVVNDSSNAGAAIFLAPGVYKLSARDAGGALRPNAGRLDLQLDMSLYGIDGDPAAVVIDANARDQLGNRLLPRSSFRVPYGRTGVIRAGCGSNSIEWLTIAGNPAAAASIETELAATNPACQPLQSTIRVTHVVTGGSARGIDIRNATLAMASHRIVADIEYSDFYFAGEGIRVANFIAADRGEIVVDMQRNRSHGNVLGCIVENNQSNDASIVVRSYQDSFDDNQLGCEIGAGLISTSGQTANYNTTRFDAVQSQFTNNIRTSGFNTEAGTPEFTDKGGITVSGGSVIPNGLPGTTNGNTAILRLRDVEFADNISSGGTDIKAIGALCEACKADADPPELAGTDNHVLVQLRGLSASAEVVTIDSEPPDPDGTNTVTVVRIR